MSRGPFDVTVVGAGPVGAAAALLHARAGARVALLEANPKAATRLAGEWLHPPGLEVLGRLGVPLPDAVPGATRGDGFVVFPDDGSEPIVLPYAGQRRGVSLGHEELVACLREAAAAHPEVTYLPGARVTAVEPGALTVERRGHPGDERLATGLVVGADGRGSTVRKSLDVAAGAPTGPSQTVVSRMAGCVLRGVALPWEQHGHVFLGGAGPALAYRLGPDAIRLILDVPLDAPSGRRAAAWLWDAWRERLPEPLRGAFREALRAGSVQWAANAVRPRTWYGVPGRVLVGDAVGHYHPLTAAGMTLGLQDAEALAEALAEGRPFDAWRAERLRRTRVPEMLAVALYEVLADHAPETVAVRRAVYRMWRRSAPERERTMGYLACDDVRLPAFARSFAGAVLRSAGGLAADALRSGRWGDGLRASAALARRMRWLVGGALGLAAPSDDAALPEGVASLGRRAGRLVGGALGLPASGDDAAPPEGTTRAPAPEVTPLVASSEGLGAIRAGLGRGAEALLGRQDARGAWEGEVVWCAMLPAQYVLARHIAGLPIPAERARRLLLQLRRTQDAQGTWGLHPTSPPYLFTTTLAYVAARLLGEPAESPWLSRARAFIAAEGGVWTIPSWGKLWLAMLGLVPWREVPPVIPEAWSLPRWLPLHPSKYYCHTRLIYLAMAVVAARRPSAPPSPITLALARELAPAGPRARGRWQVRRGDLRTPHSRALRAAFHAAAAFDRIHRPKPRARLLAELDARLRYELRTTDHTGISPVSGLLTVLGLAAGAAAGHADPDVARAWERLEGWVWEDDYDGLRIAGARSATWDTAFALQALAPARGLPGVADGLAAGRAFLATQQLRTPLPDHAAHDRIDWRGGFCFAEAWHGWPVSDCTAEAALGLLAADAPQDAWDLDEAAAFILRCQNPDGGFGSYEARRSRVGLEWLNPAEMFGDSMTEHSYVECTASCVEALAAWRRARGPRAATGQAGPGRPRATRGPGIAAAHLTAAEAGAVDAPHADPGLAPRARPEGQARPAPGHGDLAARVDAALERAVAWLRRHQEGDGSWRGVWGVCFVYGTLFALRGLRAAGVPAFDPQVVRAGRWILARQRPDGAWGEDAASCLEGRYVPAAEGTAVQTAWALLALVEAEVPDRGALLRGATWLAQRQGADGTWPDEPRAGVFFHTALLDYTLYRQTFPVWALARVEARLAEGLDAPETRASLSA